MKIKILQVPVLLFCYVFLNYVTKWRLFLFHHEINFLFCYIRRVKFTNLDVHGTVLYTVFPFKFYVMPSLIYIDTYKKYCRQLINQD